MGTTQTNKALLFKRTILLLTAMATMVLAYAGTALATTTIDTIPQPIPEQQRRIGSFGYPNTATLGQVITAPANDTRLDSFTFLMDLPNTVVFRGEVYAWDGQKATGANLYESAPRSTSGSNSLEEITFDSGGVELIPGQKYVLFATISKDYADVGSGTWASVGDDYTGGRLIFMNNGPNFDQLFTDSWAPSESDSVTNDLAFRAVFSNTVVDNTPPTLSLPDNITQEATGPDGAQVNWQDPTATDEVDGSVAVNCSKNSGDTFPLGTTTVTCEATDAASNEVSASFTVTVEDTTPPHITGVPQDINVTATSSLGATVTYSSPTATDVVDPNVSVHCSPASNTTFALGITTVSCEATDGEGNTAQATFEVNVTYAWSGLLQPINGGSSLNDRADDTSVFKLGSTIPVKFKLTAASAAITDASAEISLVKLDGRPGGTQSETTSTNAPDSGSTFRYDPTTAQYIFNLGTKGLTTGDYLMKIDLGDGTTATNTVKFSLRK